MRPGTCAEVQADDGWSDVKESWSVRRCISPGSYDDADRRVEPSTPARSAGMIQTNANSSSGPTSFTNSLLKLGHLVQLG